MNTRSGKTLRHLTASDQRSVGTTTLVLRDEVISTRGRAHLLGRDVSVSRQSCYKSEERLLDSKGRNLPCVTGKRFSLAEDFYSSLYKVSILWCLVWCTVSPGLQVFCLSGKTWTRQQKENPTHTLWLSSTGTKVYVKGVTLRQTTTVIEQPNKDNWLPWEM